MGRAHICNIERRQSSRNWGRLFLHNRPFNIGGKTSIYTKTETIITGKKPKYKNIDIMGANFTTRYPLENEGVRGIITTLLSRRLHGMYFWR